jgi:lysozyme
MTANFKLDLSPSGISFIAGFEGFSAYWYVCPAGKMTIGYGHVRRAGEVIDAPVSKLFAMSLLRQDAHRAAACIAAAVTLPLEQHQFDALTSLAFNIGAGAFERSTLLRKLNAGDEAGAADEFLKWVFAGKVRSPGLERRRAAERLLFLQGHYS